MASFTKIRNICKEIAIGGDKINSILDHWIEGPYGFFSLYVFKSLQK